MHPIQLQLCADHYNLLRLMRCLEGEIACYEVDGEWGARLPVILDIFDYVQNYPEQWHHPMEDAAFEMLLIKQVPGSDQIWALKSEHKKLEVLTRRAAELFESLASDIHVDPDHLISTTREFIRRQWDHINQENRNIYPVMDKYLGHEDWKKIKSKVQAKRDPLFDRPAFGGEDLGLNTQGLVGAGMNRSYDDAVRQEYKELFKSIIRAERGLAFGVATADRERSQALAY